MKKSNILNAKYRLATELEKIKSSLKTSLATIEPLSNSYKDGTTGYNLCEIYNAEISFIDSILNEL